MLEEKRNGGNRNDGAFVSLDMLVPKFHLLRKIDRSIDWRKIYPIVESKYSKIGRPSVDPVVLVKMVMLQHIYGIRSLRQTVAEIEVNVAYRWFIGYSLTERIPHFSTVSYNFLHRFDSDMFEQIFTLVLNEGIDGGYVKPAVIFVDSTHIKANANRKKQMKVHVPKAVKIYEEQLHKEINEDRGDHGKKPLREEEESEESEELQEKTVSETDPESGLFCKGEHERCFAYSAQTACDKNNFILDVTVVPGNVHDSVSFDSLYDKVTARFPEISTVTADAGYKTPWICKKILDSGRIPSMPYKRPQTQKGFFRKYEYVYDEYYDCYLCPNDKILNYSTTNRDGYREYKSNPKDCAACPMRQQCTNSKAMQKMVTRHIWEDYIEKTEEIRHTPHGKETYEKRSRTIERVFADAKEKHALRYTPYRGLNQVSNWVRLKFAAMNLKKLAMWKFKDENPTPQKRKKAAFSADFSIYLKKLFLFPENNNGFPKIFFFFPQNRKNLPIFSSTSPKNPCCA